MVAPRRKSGEGPGGIAARARPSVYTRVHARRPVGAGAMTGAERDVRGDRPPLHLRRIVGRASDPEIAERLHSLGHRGRVEYLALSPEDIQRHRLRAVGDHGTECAIALPRSEHLGDGAVLLLDEDHAIVVRVTEQSWLDLVAADAAAALELGYFAGNMHWPVRFSGPMLRIALRGPERDYLDRLAHLMSGGRVRRAGDD
jgi:urease accessory protein